MKTAIIWGADGGIGRSLVAALKEQGWFVVGIGRHNDQPDGAADLHTTADVADSFSIQRAILSIGQEVDSADLWIYAVGDITSEPLADMRPDTWAQIINANLTGAYMTSHYCLPLLASDAHLIFIGAVHERLRLPGLSAYAAAKAGLEAMAEALRKEQRGRKITVVRPVAIDTPLWDKVPLRLPRDAGSPATAAKRIIDVYDSGLTGIYDFHPSGE